MVKDTLAAERDRRPLTHHQREARSANMGHENEKITETHLRKLSEAERFDLFEEIEKGQSASGPTSPRLTDSQKLALMSKVLASVGWHKEPV